MIDANPLPYEMKWQFLYADFFANLIHHSPHIGREMHCYHRRGVDRLLYLTNDQHIKVKEVNCCPGVFPNVPICLSTDTARGEFGWMEQGLAVDYLAVGYHDIDRAYMLPFPLLQQAWFRQGKYWRGKYEIICNRWPDYAGHITTHQWLLVPIAAIYKALERSMCVEMPVMEQIKREAFPGAFPQLEK